MTSRPLRASFGALAIILALLLPISASAVIIDRVAARVNDEIITIYDIERAAIPFLLQRGQDVGALRTAQRPAILREVLQDLIDRHLIMQEAKRVDMAVTEDDLNQWIAYTRQQQNLTEDQLKQALAQYGVEMSEYRDMQRDQLIRMRITRFKVGARVNVSDAEVEAAYRERYGDQGGQAKFITVSHILVQPRSDAPEDLKTARLRAEAALARVQAGEPFGEVAKVASDGPTAGSEGFLGTYRRGDLAPDFEAVAFELEENVPSPVVQTRFGFHVILVSKIDLRPDPEVDERRDMLRGELQQRAMERQLKVYMEGLRTRAFVDNKLARLAR